MGWLLIEKVKVFKGVCLFSFSFCELILKLLFYCQTQC